MKRKLLLCLVYWHRAVELIGVPLGAYLYSKRGTGVGLIMLWISSGVLLSVAMITFFEVGVFLLVPALLGLIVAASGSSTASAGG
ncbi:MAG TPA: hypothetical protein VFS96_05155 [Nitrolancea sp.]|nr:hypothetical protein [Nitrolancea sp.]